MPKHKREEIEARKPDVAKLPKELRGISQMTSSRYYEIVTADAIGYCITHQTGFATYGINPSDFEESGIFTEIWEDKIDAKNLETPTDDAARG